MAAKRAKKEEASSADSTRCICGNENLERPSTDDTQDIHVDPTLFIQCEKCQVWQHGFCLGFRKQSDVPDVYFCEKCEPTFHTLANSESGQLSTYAPLVPAKTKRQDRRSQNRRQPQQEAEFSGTYTRHTINSQQAMDLRRALELSAQEALQIGPGGQTLSLKQEESTVSPGPVSNGVASDVASENESSTRNSRKRTRVSPNEPAKRNKREHTEDQQETSDHGDSDGELHPQKTQPQETHSLQDEGQSQEAQGTPGCELEEAEAVNNLANSDSPSHETAQATKPRKRRARDPRSAAVMLDSARGKRNSRTEQHNLHQRQDLAAVAYVPPKTLAEMRKHINRILEYCTQNASRSQHTKMQTMIEEMKAYEQCADPMEQMVGLQSRVEQTQLEQEKLTELVIQWQENYWQG